MNNFKDKLMLFFKGSGSTTTSEPKQKKEREKKITRLHLILAGLVLIIVLTVVIVIKVKINNKDKIYRDYETELVQAAELYYDIKDIELKAGTTERIDAETLIKENLINTDNKAINKCVGYVESVSQKNYNTGEYEITRKAYIKCGDKYKSVNYISY